jgi:ABC-type multidrug transport system permease subunit
LVPVVVCTSLSAVGLAMLVAGLAKTETQVAVYGTLLVLVLAGVSGSLMPREMMPEEMRTISLVTPHAWALDAYAQLLNPEPGAVVHIDQVLLACGVLAGFGLVFLLLAWLLLSLE